MTATALVRSRSARAGGRIATRARSHVLLAVVAGGVVGAFASAAGALPPIVVVLGVASLLGAAAAAVVGNLERLLVAVIVLDISFPIDKHFDYHEDLAAFGALGGLSISLTTLAVAALYGLWIAEALSADRTRERRRLTVSVPLVMYLALVAVAATGARDTVLASYELMLLVQTFLIFVYVANRTRTRSDVRFLVVLLVAGLLLQAFMTVWLRYTGQDLRIGALSGRVDAATGPGGPQADRIGGTVGSPNTAAAYFTLLIVPALALLLTGVHRRSKQLAFLAFPLGTVAVILTLSRGGWVALAVSLLVFSAVALWRGWLPFRYFLVIAGVFLIVLVPFHGLIAERLTGSDLGSAQSRFPLMHLAWDVIEDHPLTGVGANNFAVVLPDYATPEFGRAWLYTVHNKYLLVWAEIGLAGLLAFLWFLGDTLRRGWACVRSADPLIAPLGLGFTAAILGQMGHMFFDMFHSRPQVQSLWIVAALITAMHRIVAQEQPVADAPARRARRTFHRPGHPAPELGLR